MAVSDERGELVLLTKEPVSELLVKIEAPGAARRIASLPKEGPLRLKEGVTVTGRVVGRGKPIGGVAVGIVSEDRNSATFVGDYEATTGADGRFTFRNMPPQVDFVIYGKMESFGDRGLPATVTRATGDNGSTLELGDLTLAKVQTVAGRLVLKDGKAIPAGTRLGLGRALAWDGIETVLAPDGAFRFVGVPREEVRLHARVPGYVFGYDNPNIDWRNRSIEGRIEGNIQNLILVMEPGEREPFNSSKKPPAGVAREPGQEPLRPAKLPGR